MQMGCGMWSADGVWSETRFLSYFLILYVICLNLHSPLSTYSRNSYLPGIISTLFPPGSGLLRLDPEAHLSKSDQGEDSLPSVRELRRIPGRHAHPL